MATRTTAAAQDEVRMASSHVGSVPEVAEATAEDFHGVDEDSAVFTEPGEVWQELHRRTAEVASLAWVEKLELASLDLAGGTVTLRPRSGQREVAGFVGDRQLTRLRAEFAAVTGKRLEVKLVERPRAERSPPDGRSAVGSGSIRREVMDLPLVREALEVFPDAQLLEAREEAPDDQEA